MKMWTKYATYRGSIIVSPPPTAPFSDGILNPFLLLGQSVTHN